MSKKKYVCYGVGADVSKDFFHGCISGKTEEGDLKIIAQRKFKNTLSGHKAFKEWILKNRKDESISYQILMEVTGVYHENLLYYLHDCGLVTCLELARRVKRYMEAIGHKSKTDKLDGQGMAAMACERKLKQWQPTSKNIRELRTVLRHRKALIQSKNQFENQLHAIDHSANNSIDAVRSLKKLIKILSNQIEVVEAQSLKLAEKDENLLERVNQIVDTVKGLGMISVLTVAAETNGFESFESEKQLESYAGLDVVESSSGKVKGKTRISKKGNTYLRTSMYMPALSVIRSKVEPFYNLYIRLLKRNGGIKKKAIVAVQRKLLVLIYTLWKKKEDFDEKYHLRKEAEKLKLT